MYEFFCPVLELLFKNMTKVEGIWDMFTQGVTGWYYVRKNYLKNTSVNIEGWKLNPVPKINDILSSKNFNDVSVPFRSVSNCVYPILDVFINEMTNINEQEAILDLQYKSFNA